MNQPPTVQRAPSMPRRPIGMPAIPVTALPFRMIQKKLSIIVFCSLPPRRRSGRLGVESIANHAFSHFSVIGVANSRNDSANHAKESAHPAVLLPRAATDSGASRAFSLASARNGGIVRAAWFSSLPGVARELRNHRCKNEAATLADVPKPASTTKRRCNHPEFFSGASWLS